MSGIHDTSGTNLQGNLKRLRKFNGYTQRQLAEYLGITRQAYAHYEAGERVPNYVMLTKLADFYDATVDELIVSEEKQEKEKQEEENSPYRYLPERARELIKMIIQLHDNEQDDLLIYLRRKMERKREKEENEENGRGDAVEGESGDSAEER